MHYSEKAGEYNPNGLFSPQDWGDSHRQQNKKQNWSPVAVQV